MIVLIKEVVERVIFIDTEREDPRHQSFDTDEDEQEAIDAVESYMQALRDKDPDAIECITDCDEIMNILQYSEDDVDHTVEVIK